MEEKYKYEKILVTPVSGITDSYQYCDYYIQDNILTVYRREIFRKDGSNYYKFEAHYPMEKVIRIKCTEL